MHLTEEDQNLIHAIYKASWRFGIDIEMMFKKWNVEVPFAGEWNVLDEDKPAEMEKAKGFTMDVLRYTKEYRQGLKVVKEFYS